MTTTRFLSRTDAAAYLLKVHGLKRSPKTLAKMASQGTGPAFHKAGRDVLYAPDDLNAWAKKTIGVGAFSAIEHKLAAIAA
ncbi:helix-turn-helix domain-containing protein [Bradyrhizobium manausense]|uniref:helix-turn-helix domain-containing protein n=1 Tax=Bradyrhizobium manausense TaxID=989370 RepID=UPI0007C7109B|nr:helix-turn-helix domain-containing protein [Bradyrhizobium manausense]